MRKALVIVAAFLILGGVNFSVWQKERLLRDGRVVLLQLAPVDPRSLMQGDYMALRFAVADAAFRFGPELPETAADGRIVLFLDERGVAAFRRFDDGAPLAPGEVVMRYRIRAGEPRLATNAYFFPEGQAERYETARYGEFRVAENGDCLLTALRDGDLKRLGAEAL